MAWKSRRWLTLIGWLPAYLVLAALASTNIDCHWPNLSRAISFVASLYKFWKQSSVSANPASVTFYWRITKSCNRFAACFPIEPSADLVRWEAEQHHGHRDGVTQGCGPRPTLQSEVSTTKTDLRFQQNVLLNMNHKRRFYWIISSSESEQTSENQKKTLQ